MKLNQKTNRLSVSGFNSFFFICGILMAASEIWKQFCLTFTVNGGVYDWWYFPFQLCSIPMYLLLILPWLKKSRLRSTFLTFLMSYGLLGGIAVFADTSGLHYPVMALTLHSYLWHVTLIIIGISAGICHIREHFPVRAGLPNFIDSSGLYIICCVTASLLNHFISLHHTINMFYINTLLTMEQIGFKRLIPYIGNTAAIGVYILMTITGAGILYLLWSFIASILTHAFYRH